MSAERNTTIKSRETSRSGQTYIIAVLWWGSLLLASAPAAHSQAIPSESRFLLERGRTLTLQPEWRILAGKEAIASVTYQTDRQNEYGQMHFYKVAGKFAGYVIDDPNAGIIFRNELRNLSATIGFDARAETFVLTFNETSPCSRIVIQRETVTPNHYLIVGQLRGDAFHPPSSLILGRMEETTKQDWTITEYNREQNGKRGIAGVERWGFFPILQRRVQSLITSKLYPPPTNNASAKIGISATAPFGKIQFPLGEPDSATAATLRQLFAALSQPSTNTLKDPLAYYWVKKDLNTWTLYSPQASSYVRATAWRDRDVPSRWLITAEYYDKRSRTVSVAQWEVDSRANVFEMSCLPQLVKRVWDERLLKALVGFGMHVKNEPAPTK